MEKNIWHARVLERKEKLQKEMEKEPKGNIKSTKIREKRKTGNDSMQRKRFEWNKKWQNL